MDAEAPALAGDNLTGTKRTAGESAGVDIARVEAPSPKKAKARFTCEICGYADVAQR